MKSVKNIGLAEVKAVYSGSEGELLERLFGEHLEIGGMRSTLNLAEKAGIGKGMRGVQLFCLNGAGMRVLVRFKKVDHMIGVDPNEKMIDRGRCRTEEEGLSDRIEYAHCHPCDTMLPEASADFVWGEGTWCYVEDNEKLIVEAARLLKPGGKIAFTDWVEGNKGLAGAEADRYLRFMKFPTLESIPGYCDLFFRNGCEKLLAEDTKRFKPYMELYLNMLNLQITYDGLKLLDFDQDRLKEWVEELGFMLELAHEEKIAQGIFVAQKK